MAGGIRLKPPAQPVSAETPPSEANNNRATVIQRRRCMRGTKNQPSKARLGSAAIVPAGVESLLPASVCCVWMASVVVAEVLPGVMDDCVNDAVAPGGSPVADKVTAGMIAPFCAETVMENCAEPPGGTASDGIDDATTKSGRLTPVPFKVIVCGELGSLSSITTVAG